MASTGSGPYSFWEPLVAFVLIGAGVLSVGAMVVAAGAGHGTPALVLTAAVVLLLSTGMAMMRHSSRHEGGLSASHMDAEQGRRYRAEFRMRRAGR
jgi:hypothetical protein